MAISITFVCSNVVTTCHTFSLLEVSFGRRIQCGIFLSNNPLRRLANTHFHVILMLRLFIKSKRQHIRRMPSLSILTSFASWYWFCAAMFCMFLTIVPIGYGTDTLPATSSETLLDKLITALAGSHEHAFGLGKFCEREQCSEWVLRQQFRSQTGMTSKQYLRQVRMCLADLLAIFRQLTHLQRLKAYAHFRG